MSLTSDNETPIEFNFSTEKDVVIIPNRLEQHRTLYFSNLDFAFSTFFTNTMTKTFMAGLIGFLKGSELWINIAYAIPNLMGLIQIPGAIFSKRFPSYKPIVFWGQFAWRAFHIPIVFLPLLAIASKTKIAITLICMCIGAIGFHASTPILYEWLSEIVPLKSRGWFFSQRNAISAGIAAIIGVAIGFLFDYLRNHNQEAIGFTIVFAFTIISSLLGMLSYRKMSDIPRKTHSNESFKENLKTLKIPLQDKNFRKVLSYIAAYSIALTLHGNMFFTFGIKHLHIPYVILQATVITEALGFILFAKMWGYLIDKYGNKPILAIMAVGLALTPLPWFFCQDGNNVLNATLLIPGYIFSGFIWGGAQTCQLNIVIACSKAEHRTSSIALGLATQFIFGAIAPIIGGLIIQKLIQIAHPLDAFKYFFGIIMITRLSTLIFVSRFKEEGSTNIAHALKHIKSVSPKGFSAFKRLAKSKNFETRAGAIARVGRSHLTIATDEIIKALDDPSPKVRHEAIITLGIIGSDKESKVIINYIQNHPDFIEEEMLITLGKLANPNATIILISLLTHARSSIQYAAARALKTLNDSEATSALINAAKTTQDPDLKAIIIQTLTSLKAHNAIHLIKNTLKDSSPGVRLASAQCVIELKLKNAKQALIESLNLYQDEASSEIAYALGTIVDHELVPFILNHAKNFNHPTPRRRCLLGVAAIFKVESEFYQLLLLDGMNLEKAILYKLNAKIKRSRKLPQAVSNYFAGNELEALKNLATYLKIRRLVIKQFQENYVQDSFLLALCLI